MIVRFSLWLGFILILSSCGAVPKSGITTERETKVYKISSRLNALAPTVNPSESYKVARTTVYYPIELAKQYRLTSPPLLHNMLVNSGSRPRGLCFHWATDLIKELKKQNPESFDIYWAIANKGSSLREHSSVVITAKNQDFYDGIVFDGWRKSGKLYWIPVKQDPKYKWHPYKKKH